MNELTKTSKSYMKEVMIGGIKMEVDMRTAIKVEQYRVGDNIKVLIDEGYSDNPKWTVYPGMIAGFIQFKNLPTIVIAYLKTDYSDVEIKFININKDTKKVEIAPALIEEMPIKKADIVSKLDKEIEKAKNNVRDAETKKQYFVTHFKKYFEEVK